MKVTRKIDITNATYSLDEINSTQFDFLFSAVNYYVRYTHHGIPEKDSKSDIGELFNKLEKMKESSITIIN